MHFLPRRTVLSALVACLVVPLPGFAQTGYANQPIKLIVPFPPAGGTDIVARLMAEKVQAGTGWNFVVDNRAGA